MRRIKFFISRIKNYIGSKYSKSYEQKFIRNINYKIGQKRVLLAYTLTPFYTNFDTRNYRSSALEVLALIEIFSKLNYTIDIIYCNDVETYLENLSAVKYDVNFGFGDVFYLATNSNSAAFSILYMTENHPSESERLEKERNEYFYERRGKRIKNLRSGRFYKEYHLSRDYGAIITMSELSPFLGRKEKVYEIYPTGLFNNNFDFSYIKTFDKRRSFIWMGTSGATVHKGLDLLLDVFSKRQDIILHICGLNDQDRDLLNIPKRTNIIDHGFVNISDDSFLKIVDSCFFMLFPSCSEAFATSVCTCMLHGLLPVVMANSGFNRAGQDVVFYMNHFDLKYLEDYIDYLLGLDEVFLLERRTRVFDFAHSNFTISNFSRSVSEIFKELL